MQALHPADQVRQCSDFAFRLVSMQSSSSLCSTGSWLGKPQYIEGKQLKQMTTCPELRDYKTAEFRTSKQIGISSVEVLIFHLLGVVKSWLHSGLLTFIMLQAVNDDMLIALGSDQVPRDAAGVGRNKGLDQERHHQWCLWLHQSSHSGLRSGLSLFGSGLL